MINTARIASGFDVELQIGSGWFFTALTALNEKGLLLPDGPPPPFQPDAPVVITAVTLIQDPVFDLEVVLTIGIIPITIKAALTLSADGQQLDITTSVPDIGFSIPFGILSGLAGTPQLLHLRRNGDNAECMAFLANLDIQASPQSEEPLPPGATFERGNPGDALSFLPVGKDIALGLSQTTFSSFANHIWHTNLRAEDGSHPLPDASSAVGSWSMVSASLNNSQIRIKLEGDIPVDSPLIDVIPDPHVTITLILTPKLKDGQLTFELDSDTDIDTGILGDLFAFIGGGLVGFIIGIFTGGALAGAIAGAVIGVVLLEIAEVVVEGVVQQIISGKINGKPIGTVICSKDGIAQIGTPNPPEGGFDLSIFKAIPSSIPIFTDEPDILHSRSILVTTIYDDLVINSNGLAVAGMSASVEKYQSKVCQLTNRTYNNDVLESLEYSKPNGREPIVLSLTEIADRMQFSELKPPFKVINEIPDATFRIPEGKLATVTLIPEAIRRADTVVTDIRFTGGVDLKVQDCIALQDAGVLYLMGFQLIHPSNASPYYRAKADETVDNNFEHLPEF